MKTNARMGAIAPQNEGTNASPRPSAHLMGRGRRPLTSKQLWKLVHPTYRLHHLMEKAAQGDEQLLPISKAVTELWLALSRVREQRAMKEAEAADKGEILWMLFKPRDSVFGSRNTLTRTPNRMIRDEYFSMPAQTHLADREAAYEDLAREWGKTPLDLDKFRAHAAKVDGQYREWQAKAKEAA